MRTKAIEHKHTKRQSFKRSSLKQRIIGLLQSGDVDTALKELKKFPARQVVNPLFSCLYNRDERVRWAAVSVMGAVVAALADEDMEGAREIVRRLMWNLNDESGNIGWGSPEAMGEIMSCHEGLAKEYASILISYSKKEENYLEHEGLQRGLMWGIGRLAQMRPDLLKDAVMSIKSYLNSNDATTRGLAAWAIGLLDPDSAGPQLENLLHDNREIQLYIDRKLIKKRVRDIALEAMQGKNY